MNYKQLFENFSVAIVSQSVGFLMSVVTSLLVPKVLGITDFGYWQLFIFYTSYAGFFHFGLNDGFYLLESGQTRETIDKREVKSQFLVCLSIQLIVSLLIVLTTFFTSLEESRQFIILLVSVFLILNNSSLFLGYTFQALNETKLYSFSVMIDKIIFLVPLVSMLILGVSDFRPYIVFYVASKAFSLGYCLNKAKKFIRSHSYSFSVSLRNAFKYIKVGIILMLSGICSSLILGVARFAIDYRWGIDTFGEVSLALSIMTFFLAFVTQASMVLFPALKHTTNSESLNLYEPLETLTGLVFPIVYLFYFPVSFFVSIWLPQYSNSILWLAIFLPACVFDGKMNLCSITYFKVIRKERVMLAVNLISMLLSLLLVALATFVFCSLVLVLLAALYSIFFRAAISEIYLEHVLSTPKSKRLISELVLAVAFLLFVFIVGPNYIIGESLILLSYTLFLLANRKKVVPLSRKIFSALIKR